VIIAIDGPAGSGKSTTAREVARRLGFLYLDTGAMYRAVALAFLRGGVEPGNQTALVMLPSVRLRLLPTDAGTVVQLGDEDVTAVIRSTEVTRMSSEVSALPPVREFMVAEQRRMVREHQAEGRGVVVEGRDIGTVVFPEAELKVFLTASPEERARRRVAELREGGGRAEEALVRREMADRDRNDSSRAVSPLRPASDALMLDTTALSFEAQVDRIVSMARERGKQLGVWQ